jgi:hypothetical protein
MSNIQQKQSPSTLYSGAYQNQAYWPYNNFGPGYNNYYYPNWHNYPHQWNPYRWNPYRWHPHQSNWGPISAQPIWPFQDTPSGQNQPVEQRVPDLKFPNNKGYDTFLAEVKVTDPKVCSSGDCTFQLPLYKPRK